MKVLLDIHTQPATQWGTQSVVYVYFDDERVERLSLWDENAAIFIRLLVLACKAGGVEVEVKEEVHR